MVGFVFHHWRQSAGCPRKGLLKYVQSLLHAVIQDREWVAIGHLGKHVYTHHFWLADSFAPQRLCNQLVKK